MKRLLSVCIMLGLAGYAQAQPNLLFNGNFEVEPMTTNDTFYYDNAGGDSGTAFDVPGWEAFAVGDSGGGSWVLVSYDTNYNTWLLNLTGLNYSAPDPFLGLAGMKTAVSNRVAVTPGNGYYGTVTYDNYFDPVGIAYFIDWFDAGGATLSSSGGPLEDPNGAFSFASVNQRIAITGIAPANATRAGVRFQSVNAAPNYAGGATADNFQFGESPVVTITPEANNVIVSWSNGPGFILQQTDELTDLPVWTDLGDQNPQTIPMTSGSAFFRLVSQ